MHDLFCNSISFTYTSLSFRYEKQKRKLEVVSPGEGNETCQKRMRYSQHSEPRSKVVMKTNRKETSVGARHHVNHSYGTRLQAIRKRKSEFSHEGNDGFGKKRKLSEFSIEKYDSLKKWRKHAEISDKDSGYMHGDINERNGKRKSCEFLSKVDVQKMEKRNRQENNQAGNVKNPQERYKMKENQPLTAAIENIVFIQNENLAKSYIFEDEFANESIQRMYLANNGLDTHMEEYMHQIESKTFGEDQKIMTMNAFQNQILEENGNNLNGFNNFLELTCNQEDINNKQTLHQNYNLEFPYNHSCIERADIIMNETFVIIQRLDAIDITNIGHCNEPIDSDLSQDHSCLYPAIKDLKIQVDQYEDNDYPNIANQTTTSSYMESMDTNTSMTHTKVTVKQEPMWDDYEKETDCTEDSENDSEDIDMRSSTRSQLRIRPIKRRKRALVPLRIRLLKSLTMRKAWKENTTCCLKYCWIDWPTVTVGQI
ncbi:hypothetical protein ACJMK2_037355 [Sinanodonta woodiana]|uniref:Uncharacterized protein n=1 Tax=Sinanodonta woodiana TaxID=1069815 RepID=A0ABD3WK37_SINWO